MSFRRAIPRVRTHQRGDCAPRQPRPPLEAAAGRPMSRSDPLLMLADIARLAFENPDLDEALVRAIYQHQVLTTGRQPTLRQAREYIGHLTSHLDDATIRVTLGLPPRGDSVREAVAWSPRRRARARAGRPGWTPELFWARYRDALGRADAAPHERLDRRAPRDARRRARDRARLPAQARQAVRAAARVGGRTPDRRPDETRGFRPVHARIRGRIRDRVSTLFRLPPRCPTLRW